ncbi:MAG: hypothetical protein JRH11_17995 [Deltaproteobacteria bacterium]|nr:hypothetical protein [Deltaproteobacteria bacterium]
MSQRLLPCPGCDRHVRVAEPVCPFCGEAIPLAMQNAGPAPVPGRRLGRAARFAFGAAVAGAVAFTGCGDDTSPTPDTGTIGPAYGAPADTGVDPDTGTDAGAEDATIDGGDVPLYGSPSVDGG